MVGRLARPQLFGAYGQRVRYRGDGLLLSRDRERVVGPCPLVSRPAQFILVVGVLLLLLIYVLSRTSWRPTAPLRLAHRRAWGQTLASAARMYLAQPRLVVGIGILLIPVSLLITLLQTLLLHGTSVLGIESGAEGNSSSPSSWLRSARPSRCWGWDWSRRRRRAPSSSSTRDGRSGLCGLTCSREQHSAAARRTCARRAGRVTARKLHLPLPSRSGWPACWALIAPTIELEVSRPSEGCDAAGTSCAESGSRSRP